MPEVQDAIDDEFSFKKKKKKKKLPEARTEPGDESDSKDDIGMFSFSDHFKLLLYFFIFFLFFSL